MLDRLDFLLMLSECPENERRQADKQFDRQDQANADALACLAGHEVIYQKLKFGRLD